MPDKPTGGDKYRQAVRRQRDERTQRQAEHQAWREGRIRPFVITQALDTRELYGPLVDELCGTTEPAVDMWEDGQLYPTWDELQALAELTDYPIALFTTVPHEAIGFEDTSLRFHLKRGQKLPPPLVRCFEPIAIEAATGATRCPYCGKSSRPPVMMAGLLLVPGGKDEPRPAVDTGRSDHEGSEP